MTPKIALLMLFAAALAAVAVALIALVAISLCIAALLPRGHPAADALRRFASQVPRVALGSGRPVFGLVALALLLLFPLFFA
jgi:hypothetical protein